MALFVAAGCREFSSKKLAALADLADHSAKKVWRELFWVFCPVSKEQLKKLEISIDKIIVDEMLEMEKFLASTSLEQAKMYIHSAKWVYTTSSVASSGGYIAI